MPKEHGTVPRGEIKGWSSKSRGRLRQKLMTLDPMKEWITLNVTHTIPGPELEPDEFRRVVKYYHDRLQRSGKVCGVWRVELQERRQPHLHEVLFMHPDCVMEKSIRERMEDWQQYDALPPWFYQVNAEWKKAVDVLGECEHRTESKDGKLNLQRGLRSSFHGADMHMSTCIPAKSGKDVQGWWRYLCDHTSKSKQAQMGWKGRQWGVINKSLLTKAHPEAVRLSKKQYYTILRWMRRLTRSWSYRGNRGLSAWFSDPATIRKMISYAQDLHPAIDANASKHTGRQLMLPKS